MVLIVIIAGKANISGWCHMSASLPGFHEHNHLWDISLPGGLRSHQLGCEITLVQSYHKSSLNDNIHIILIFLQHFPFNVAHIT